MSIYNRLRATTTRLMSTYGQGVVEFGTTTTVDGAEEWLPPTVTTTWETINATVSGVSKEYVDQVNVIASDRQILTQAEISPGQLIRIDGAVVTVLRVVPIPAAGEPVAVRYIVRG
jgi:hypothetical protein